MLILAASSGDKGKQLETLTVKLLQHLGYENCETNVMANGGEVDVRAEFTVPLPGNSQKQLLLCECKALKSAVDVTQWFKFLGKLLHDQSCNQKETAGCFIALSGANGHVQGNYNELAKHRKNIQLLQGDSLLDEVRKICRLVDLKRVSDTVASLTDRTPSRFEPAYHHGAMYWIVQFAGGEFSLFDSDGNPTDVAEMEAMAAMVSRELNAATLIDPREDQKNNLRVACAKSFVISNVMQNDGELPDFTKLVISDGLVLQDVAAAVRLLVSDGVLTEANDGRVYFESEGEDRVKRIATLYRTLFNGGFTSNTVASSFYQQNIDEALFDEICLVQESLEFPTEKRSELLELLRLTPTGLANSLSPIPMITVSRSEGHVSESVNAFHREYFHHLLMDYLRVDFGRGPLGSFYHKSQQLRELDTKASVTLKSETGVVLQKQLRYRLGVGELHERHGGGFISIAIVHDAPEPWERTPGKVMDEKNNT